jgi:hypothetical protein
VCRVLSAYREFKEYKAVKELMAYRAPRELRALPACREQPDRKDSPALKAFKVFREGRE